MRLNNKKIDLMDFIPKNVRVGKDSKKIPLETKELGTYILFRYLINRRIPTKNSGTRIYSEILPRFINKNNKTFEVLGLLQAEMGKTQNGCITFCNHEFKIIRNVMNWFQKEFEIMYDDWKWYIKVNIIKPNDSEYRSYIENKVVDFWREKTQIFPNKSYPKKVSYISDTKNTILKASDYGTLILDYKNNLISQIIKSFVKKLSQRIVNCEKTEIKYYMRGIIAGESNVELHLKDKRYRIYISAKDIKERLHYQKCLKIFDIESRVYRNFHGLIISGWYNNFRLLCEKLMCVSSKKYNKFLRMMNAYGDFRGLDEWKMEIPRPHNKIPQLFIDHIIKLHHKNPDWPAWRIAEIVGVSDIKVQRVRREYGLRKSLLKTTKEQAEQIMKIKKKNPHLTQAQIAAKCGLHEGRVCRVLRKYIKSKL